ncbi:DUF503 domain-containing protein [Deferribacterales bacterium Es71-Z0220]|jgi:uncharacterized protein YlxP (DUF503 family)|uniref:DUF503 domain-containing protein n=1 Tax=Deferrivibrio essentukiensis TaxID=2880922 RepID=UPI001F6040EA|nr:DUF503 domain-containing protein [Deferrivibrio essentukiensis]MCB4203586.1 DUF503 domain-containing protein [Deferrivibrio essentukiensis]
MIIGVLNILLEIPSAFSLKEKRRVLNSLKTKLKSKFNISVAEIGEKDIWNRAEIGVALISDDTSFCNEQLGKVVDFVDNQHDVVVLEINQEIL